MNGTTRAIGLGFGIVLLAGFLGTGCQTARMAVDEGLSASAEEWAVTGRQGFLAGRKLSFGPYTVTDIRRGWKKTSTWSVFGLKSSKASQRFEFALQNEQGDAWPAECATGVKWKDLQGGFLEGTLTIGLESDTVFACVFGQAPGPIWKLAMSQGSRDLVLNGILSDGARNIEVRGTRSLQGTPIALTEPSGYEFFDGSRPIAAVEVMNAGAVWLDRALDPALREPVAAAATALLLYRDIQQHAGE